jgi:hypothetical protein
MWLDCNTMQAIGDAIGVPRKTADEWVGEKRKLADFATAPESRQHFDVWQFAHCRQGFRFAVGSE